MHLRTARLLIGTLATLAAVALLAVAGIWLVTAREVTRLRSIAAVAPAVPARITAAIIAAEELNVARPRFSFRRMVPPSGNVVYCGPRSLASTLVKPIFLTPGRRPLRNHLEAVVATYVVAYAFTSDELLRIYAHELYLGTVDGRDILGVEAASRFYFVKDARELTIAEAAMIAAMVRSPNVFSPVRHPARALERRNRVLARMADQRLIDDRQYRTALVEPL